MDFSDFCFHTERIIIRSFTDTDIDEIFQIKKDNEFYKYIHDEPWTEINDAKDFIHFASWLYRNDINRNWFRLFFAICDRQSNKLIGYCGYGNTEYMPQSVEVFYGIKVDQQNKGYGSEACRAILKIAYNEMQITEFIGFVHINNVASRRVLEKSSFVYSKTINNATEPFTKYNGQLLYTLNRFVSN